jgi:hypothetical protein
LLRGPTLLRDLWPWKFQGARAACKVSLRFSFQGPREPSGSFLSWGAKLSFSSFVGQSFFRRRPLFAWLLRVNASRNPGARWSGWPRGPGCPTCGRGKVLRRISRIDCQGRLSTGSEQVARSRVRESVGRRGRFSGRAAESSPWRACVNDESYLSSIQPKRGPKGRSAVGLRSWATCKVDGFLRVPDASALANEGHFGSRLKAHSKRTVSVREPHDRTENLHQVRRASL